MPINVGALRAAQKAGSGHNGSRPIVMTGPATKYRPRNEAEAGGRRLTGRLFGRLEKLAHSLVRALTAALAFSHSRAGLSKTLSLTPLQNFNEV